MTVRLACILRCERDHRTFDENLFEILRRIQFRWLVTDTFGEFMAQVSRATPKPSLLLVDPRTKGFTHEAFQKQVLQNEELCRKKIVLVRDHFDDDLFSMEDLLDVDGMVGKNYEPYQLSFVIQRILFPHFDNRRRHPRALVTVQGEYKRHGDVGAFPAKSVDLSVAGAFLNVLNPLPVGSRIDVAFQIPGMPRPISCAGTVVHNRSPSGEKEEALQPRGMGIRFDEIFSTDRSRLSDFITPRFLRVERRATVRSITL